MAKIHTLEIKHFKGIEHFKYNFKSDFNCIIGRGDSGKSTILEAISLVFSPTWNIQLFDNDFFNCDTSAPIVIQATIIDCPPDLIKEDKFGLYLRGITESNTITDETTQITIPALTIELKVEENLEPKWHIITGRDQDLKEISSKDRERLNTFLVADYVERHFMWTKGSPLYSLLKQEFDEDDKEDNILLHSLREAKSKIDSGSFSQFDSAITKLKATASLFGLDIANTATTIDFKELLVKDGRVSLHEHSIPFRLKGKGSKRLTSMAIQSSLISDGGIVLIDEIEQGLEPDRVQHLVSTLKKENKGQIFITTHSRDVVVELEYKDIVLLKKGANRFTEFSSDLQGLIRKNPEALFAKKVILCEGATEIGFLRAFNDFRIGSSKKNMSYLGVRLADGAGNEISKYCTGLLTAGYDTVVFCDSDEPSLNKEKSRLTSSGALIIDWPGALSLEQIIFKYVPFLLLKEIFNLAVKLKQANSADESYDLTEQELWNSVMSFCAKQEGFPSQFTQIVDSLEIREALGLAAKKQGWFKRQDKAFELGNIVFRNFDSLNPSPITEMVIQLSQWLD